MVDVSRESCVSSHSSCWRSSPHFSLDVNGFQVENSGRTEQHKLNAQSLRLFGLRKNDDAKDVHRAGANR